MRKRNSQWRPWVSVTQVVMVGLVGLVVGCPGEPVDLCAGVTCDQGFACDPDTGTCVPVDPCEGVTCGEGETCVDGECVSTDPCAGVTCGEGEVCVDGQCVSVDPCEGVTCGEGETCVDGVCVSTDPCAGVTCGEGEVCVDGQCYMEDFCEGVTCDEGETCVGGECVPVDPCAGVTCDAGEVCVDGECIPTFQTTLFVVNNGAALTSYANPGALDGEIAPTTRLNLGSATSLFQPRSPVVTREGRLLVSRQNGGIVGYDSALTADEDTPADIVVEGDNTKLESPISFAYDATNDRLYVGDADAEAGILVFENVSSAAFDGDDPPARTFGPPDRVPFGTDTTISMTVHAMDLDSSGNLYVSDMSGLNANRARILVFADPGTADGLTEPARTFASTAWSTLEDMVVDDSDVFYVVDGEASVLIFSDASTLDGDVSPSAVVTVQLTQVGLEGVVVASDGTGYLADRDNRAVYSFDDLAELSGGAFVPDRILEGFETRLSSPRQMFLLEE